MGLFGFLKKDKEASGSKKGFFELTVAAVEKLTDDTVKVILEVPQELKNDFHFVPGQYLDFSVPVNGRDEHRSYSICSGPAESLAIAVKEIKKVLFHVGSIMMFFPEVNFSYPNQKGHLL